MPNVLKADIRGNSTKSELRAKRNAGKIPGVVYGKKVTQTIIYVDRKDIQSILSPGSNGIVEMDIPAVGKHPVMLSEIQRDSITREYLHIDFHQINMDEPIKTSVTLEMQGESPGEREGGILSIITHEIEIRCLPQQIPASIQVDVSSLHIGESVTVGDLHISEGIEVKTDPSTLVVTILAPQKEVVEEEKGDVEAKTAEAAPESVPS